MNRAIPIYFDPNTVLELLNQHPKLNYIFLIKNYKGNPVPVIVDFKNTLYALCSTQIFLQLKESGQLKEVNVAVPAAGVHYHYYLDIQDRGDTNKIGELATAGSPCPKTINSQLK